MFKENLLYIRTDYRIEGKITTKEDFEDHIKYLTDIANERFFMGGGFIHNPGGMIVFEAKNIDDARMIAEGDPLISRELYRYELKEWELIILSESLNNCKKIKQIDVNQ